MDIQDIKARWDGVKRGYERMSFEQAKADMDYLVAEIERLKEIEQAKEYAEALLKQGLMRYKNVQQQLVDEIGAVVRKYDTF